MASKMSFTEEEIELLVEKKYDCTNCQQPINEIGIQCLECHQGNMRLCVECFGLGAEIGQHKADHGYRFFSTSMKSPYATEGVNEGASSSSKSTTVTRSSREGAAAVATPSIWSLQDDLRLLKAVELLGIGNWKGISKEMGNRTPQEVKAHYDSEFVKGPIGEATWPKECSGPLDHTEKESGPFSELALNQLPPLQIGKKLSRKLGYMPARDSFDVVPDEEAEKLLTDITFDKEDTDITRDVKFAMIDMYNRRLAKRQETIQMVQDYQLVDAIALENEGRNGGASSSKGKCNPTSVMGQLDAHEESLRTKLRPCMRILPSHKYENMIGSLVAEKELRFRIEELYKYRANGITRIADCKDFEKFQKSKAADEQQNQRLVTMSEENGQNECLVASREEGGQEQRGMKHKPEATVVDNERPTTSREAIARQTRNGMDQAQPLALPTAKKAIKITGIKKGNKCTLKMKRASARIVVKKTAVKKVPASTLKTKQAALRTDMKKTVAKKVKARALKTKRASLPTVVKKTVVKKLKKRNLKKQRSSLRFKPTRVHIPIKGHCRTCDRALSKNEKKGKK